MNSLRWISFLVGAALVVLLLVGIEWYTQHGVSVFVREVIDWQYRFPHWLWLLLAIPLLIALSIRDEMGRWAAREWGKLFRAGRIRAALARMWGDFRRMNFRQGLILLTRAMVVALVILALADPMHPRDEEELTVLVVIDQSFSIPQEISEGSVRDDRWHRLKTALHNASKRPHRQTDRIGVISFARQPRLEFPATSLPELGLPPLGQGLDRNYTDIGAAIQLALASFPQGTARRIILISDGNENRGSAMADAQTAELNGVPIDVVPIKYRSADEVIVDRIDVPTETPAGQDIPLRVIMHNYTGRPVRGMVRITRSVRDGPPQTYEDKDVVVSPGPYEHVTKWPAAQGSSGGVMVYNAQFIPNNLPRDRAENNVASAPVIIRPEGRRYLIVYRPDPVINAAQQTDPLKQGLLRASAAQRARAADPEAARRTNLQVDLMPASSLPSFQDVRRFSLANYDTIFLFNVPADSVTKDQQEALRQTVHDQGTGLVVVGGPESFGAGRWQNEPLEAALPVDTSIRSKKVRVKAGLVLIMHASEMQEGNYWQKKIADTAVDKLGAQDEVGILYWDWSAGHSWQVEMQEVGKNRKKIKAEIDTMNPGDMPQLDPSLIEATKALSDPKRGFGAKHIIFISDGDHGLLTDATLLNPLKANGITLSTVGITTHGDAAHDRLKKISAGANGKHYAVDDPNKLPSIYMQELKTMSQNFLHEKRFRPTLTNEPGDPFLDWFAARKQLPPLNGFVRTSRKSAKEKGEDVQLLMEANLGDGDENPILAQWQYGLGKVVAFTSDAGGMGATEQGQDKSWAREWLSEGNRPLFDEFWWKIAQWSQRNIDDTGLTLKTRHENGKIRISLVDNRPKADREAKPLQGLKVRVSSAGAEGKAVPLDPTSAGVYEAEVEGETSGSYTVAVQGTTQRDGKEQKVIFGWAAVAVPYSPEFATVKDDEGLLTQIAQRTKGRVIPEEQLALTDLYFDEGTRQKERQEIWHWLLFAAAVLLFFDAALRRIAINPMTIAAAVADAWRKRKLRRALTGESQSYFDRLKTRKAEVGEKIAEAKEAAPAAAPPPVIPVEYPPTAGDAPPPPPVLQGPPVAPKPPPPPPKPPAPDGDDFAGRLLKAKKKAREKLEGEE